ncbi:hypothetical protein L484_012137 [Morus notabilis]|uniref:Uncharacterized protein n=1 Tax=Morus notabilis TaxID=981085 RepID=W9R7B9_9ROSA|nr:X-linked retinitis pigmentosa GTPase regulator [Morus notabilis]EXB75013.1 hypothetical protein L484_012137 [Morus notabilis]
MDFHSLARKELQILCKKNKIPANLTNVAMADSLASLQHVEGLDEFLNESKSESQQFPEGALIGSPDAPRTSCRTSTRRKPISDEPESSQILTRTCRGTRRGVVEEMDQERTEVVPKTPAARSSRRGRPASARQKTESQKDESSVQRACSTRRSVRLLEKTMEKLSLVKDKKIQPMKIDDIDSSVTMSGTNGSSSEVCSGKEKTVDLEVSSVLKSEGSPEIQIDLNNNNVQEKREDHVSELEESKSKSELMDLVEKSVENMDVIEETFGDKEINSVQLANFPYETQNSHSEDSKAEQDLGSEDPLAAEVLDDVSVNIIAQDIAPKSSLRLEENEFSNVKESVEPIPFNTSSSCVQADKSETLSSEASAVPETKSWTIKSPDGQSHILTSIGPDMRLTEDDYQGKFDFESESITEEEHDDDSCEFEDAEASDQNSSEHLEHISDEKVETEEKEASLVDVNVVEAEVAIAESSYQRKCDFESESVTEEETEEETGDDSSEEESVESEAWDIESTDTEIGSDDNVVEAEVAIAESSYQRKCDFESESVTEEEMEEETGDDSSEEESVESEASDIESTDTEIGSDDNAESEETNLEASLVDIVVAEAEMDIKTQSQFICDADDASMKNFTCSGALVDVCVVSAEEFTTITSEHLPASLKETSPAQHLISGGSKVTTKSPLPSFSADQPSGQFPRPTLPTPSKSSSKSHPIIQMITDALDENEGNAVAQDEVKKNKNPTDDICSMPKLYEGTSLRKLQKMLKENLQIENEKKVGKPRVALQTLPENRMAADEPQKEN